METLTTTTTAFVFRLTGIFFWRFQVRLGPGKEEPLVVQDFVGEMAFLSPNQQCQDWGFVKVPKLVLEECHKIGFLLFLFINSDGFIRTSGVDDVCTVCWMQTRNGEWLLPNVGLLPRQAVLWRHASAGFPHRTFCRHHLLHDRYSLSHFVEISQCHTVPLVSLSVFVYLTVTISPCNHRGLDHHVP